jgi:hypothetical protein
MTPTFQDLILRAPKQPPKCVQAWEAILKCLQVITGLEEDNYDKSNNEEEKRQMFRILDQTHSVYPDCYHCDLPYWVEFAKGHNNSGYRILAMNMDYIRNPGILYADLKCPEIAENVAPGAFASEVEDASRSHFTSLHRRIVGHALDANELPYYDSDVPTFGRVCAGIFTRWALRQSECQPRLTTLTREHLPALCSVDMVHRYAP